MERVCIIGSGNWGSAVAKIVGSNARRLPWVEDEVRIWVYEEVFEGRPLTEIINTEHENPKYLPEVRLPENVVAVPDLVRAVDDASLLVFVLPHQFLQKACHTIRYNGNIRSDTRAISLVKGIDVEGDELELASDTIRYYFDNAMDVSVMMGANIANEVAQELFCETTIGYRSEANAALFKELFETTYFRVSLVANVTGVELCGALKNVVALGAGFVDGLQMGGNTKAAVIRIGLGEIRRVIRLYSEINSRAAEEDGAETVVPEDLYFESCGVADLITSCFGGRNRRVAEAYVVTGKPIEQLERELLGGQSLQGPPTAKMVYMLLQGQGRLADFPLMTAIYEICFEGYSASHLFKNLSH